MQLLSRNTLQERLTDVCKATLEEARKIVWQIYWLETDDAQTKPEIYFVITFVVLGAISMAISSRWDPKSNVLLRLAMLIGSLLSGKIASCISRRKVRTKISVLQRQLADLCQPKLNQQIVALLDSSYLRSLSNILNQVEPELAERVRQSNNQVEKVLHLANESLDEIINKEGDRMSTSVLTEWGCLAPNSIGIP